MTICMPRKWDTGQQAAHSTKRAGQCASAALRRDDQDVQPALRAGGRARYRRASGELSRGSSRLSSIRPERRSGELTAGHRDHLFIQTPGLSRRCHSNPAETWPITIGWWGFKRRVEDRHGQPCSSQTAFNGHRPDGPLQPQASSGKASGQRVGTLTAARASQGQRMCNLALNES